MVAISAQNNGSDVGVEAEALFRWNEGLTDRILGNKFINTTADTSAKASVEAERKKQQAEKTIEKKDQKLKEINSILDEEINPTLAKLKEEKSAYTEYQRIQRELELSLCQKL